MRTAAEVLHDESEKESGNDARGSARQNIETVRKVAHSMKGAGGSDGFDRVFTMAATIDTELAQLGGYRKQIHVAFDRTQPS